MLRTSSTMPITIRIAPGISAPVPRLTNPTIRRVRPGMTMNSGQLPPGSKPVNWTRSANRPRTTRTTPRATLEPALRCDGPGATNEGGRGWYEGGGGGGGGVMAASAVAGSAGPSVDCDSSKAEAVSAAGVWSSSGFTSAVIAELSELSTGISLPGAKTSGAPASMSELTWTAGSPSPLSAGVPGAPSFGFERLRFVIGPPAYTVTRAMEQGGGGRGFGTPRDSWPAQRGCH